MQYLIAGVLATLVRESNPNNANLVQIANGVIVVAIMAPLMSGGVR